MSGRLNRGDVAVKAVELSTTEEGMNEPAVADVAGRIPVC